MDAHQQRNGDMYSGAEPTQPHQRNMTRATTVPAQWCREEAASARRTSDDCVDQEKKEKGGALGGGEARCGQAAKHGGNVRRPV